MAEMVACRRSILRSSVVLDDQAYAGATIGTRFSRANFIINLGDVLRDGQITSRK